jgi:hypothetical protein
MRLSVLRPAQWAFVLQHVDAINHAKKLLLLSLRPRPVGASNREALGQKEQNRRRRRTQTRLLQNVFVLVIYSLDKGNDNGASEYMLTRDWELILSLKGRCSKYLCTCGSLRLSFEKQLCF